jgi:Tfp pilus assembly protein PilE
MYRKMQYGRSMIEMIGVLAIIGVLSVGGFGIVAKAMKNQRYTQIMSNVAELAASAKKMSCQFLNDNGYSNYGIFLYKSGKYPNNLTYVTSGADVGKYVGTLDVTYKFETGSDGSSSFKITLENVPQDLCIRMASDNWGSTRSTGFKEITVGNKTNTALDIEEAVVACSDSANNKITLSYYGCRQGQ